MTTIIASGSAPAETTISSWMTFLLAAACGLIVANIYYAQPLIGPIGAELGLPPHAAGLIVTMAQIGYGVGLLFIVPLGDLMENRRLVLGILAVATLALLGAAISTQPAGFLAAMLFVGLGSVAVQTLIPYAAHLAPEARRGRVVGNVSVGLLLGIMLSRPFSSFITALSSWHVVYLTSCAVMILLIAVLRFALPRRVPTARLSYGALLASMVHIARSTPVLRRRALYQAFLFAAFSLFWTTTPLLLASPAFGLTQNGIALFALAGAAGAVASPIAGRVADRGWTKLATAFAMVLAIVALLIGHASGSGSLLALMTLTLSGILLDFGVQTNLVLGQRAIFALSAEHRSRLNGLYMATFFAGGALGSAIGGWAYATGGWNFASWIGICFPVVALLIFLTERQK